MMRNRSLVMIGLLAAFTMSSHGAGAAGGLDDATILAIFDQANTADIVTGRLGAKYAASEEVRALARMVVTDHVAVQHLGRELAKKLELIPTPPDNDTSTADLARAVALLQSKKGADFDKAYLQYEVAFHQSVIDAVKGTLLPAITSTELRSLMNAVLPDLEHHLAATKALARRMGVK